jgi:hypothetical protein
LRTLALQMRRCPFCGTKEVYLELGSQHELTLPNERGGSSTSGVIGHGCLDAGVNEPVLLKMPGFERKYRGAFTVPDGLELDPEGGDEGRAGEDSLYFRRDR